MNIYQLCDEIREMLRSNDLWCDEVWPINDENRICVDIQWGDWKHEHLRCKYLVGDYLNGKGIRFDHSEVITEEDGSDCYSASHYYRLREVS